MRRETGRTVGPAMSWLRLTRVAQVRQNGSMITTPFRGRQWLAAFVLLAAPVCVTASAVASDIEISIDIKANGQHVRSTRTEIEPSPQKPLARPVCRLKLHKDFSVSWKATNGSKRETFKDVMIHCVVVTEKEPGQLKVPSLKDPTQEAALTMDFKPGGSASGKFRSRSTNPATTAAGRDSRDAQHARP